MWFSPLSGRNFTSPGNLGSRGLANAILKQAGPPKAF
jgi:hypothetical protein